MALDPYGGPKLAGVLSTLRPRCLLRRHGRRQRGCALVGILLDARGRSAGRGAESALEALAGDVPELDEVDGDGPELARRFYVEKKIPAEVRAAELSPARTATVAPPRRGAAELASSSAPSTRPTRPRGRRTPGKGYTGSTQVHTTEKKHT
ncbi:hypothetical protein [Sorangium cellulosum]|uniref:Uncharacterized protein n=1 Tax=Sorangium cellulosum So0157-2 TaxID=1254432 RepID=S4Y8S6_SORCE|nr:hypothetical protein [Sorangium cellulosum]AGP41284.1 hypothetical protein SCE1572_46410 [Sorangium cellulosum So0157-2]